MPLLVLLIADVMKRPKDSRRQRPARMNVDHTSFSPVGTQCSAARARRTRSLTSREVESDLGPIPTTATIDTARASVERNNPLQGEELILPKQDCMAAEAKKNTEQTRSTSPVDELTRL